MADPSVSWEQELAKYEIGDRVAFDDGELGTVREKRPGWQWFALLVENDKPWPNGNPNISGWNLDRIRKLPK